MNDNSDLATQDTITAVLEGGPASLPDALRSRPAPADEERIKVPYLNGYEHFERAGDADDEARVVFRWTARTRIAE